MLKKIAKIIGGLFVGAVIVASVKVNVDAQPVYYVTADGTMKMADSNEDVPRNALLSASFMELQTPEDYMQNIFESMNEIMALGVMPNFDMNALAMAAYMPYFEDYQNYGPDMMDMLSLLTFMPSGDASWYLMNGYPLAVYANLVDPTDYIYLHEIEFLKKNPSLR